MDATFAVESCASQNLQSLQQSCGGNTSTLNSYHLHDNTDHFLYFLPGSETHGTLTHGSLAQEWREEGSHKQNCLCNFNSKSGSEEQGLVR